MQNNYYLTDMFNISSIRYSMLFSYENIYGLFRLKETEQVTSMDYSVDYDLLAFEIHNCNSIKDILIDIYYSEMSGKIQLLLNDIICIRFNGKVSCYRYVHLMDYLNLEECFKPITGFFDIEIERYISKIHKEKMVLSVLDGRLISIEKNNLKGFKFFCLENASFNKAELKDNIFCFSLYGLTGKNINKVDSLDVPFVSLNNALYYFYKIKRSKKNAFLVFDREELKMIRDAS